MPNQTKALAQIETLEREHVLYHATPIWRLEYIFESGLRVDCARLVDKDKRPYQCLSPSMRMAIGMAKITNDYAFKETKLNVVGVIGFSTLLLPGETRNALKEDPMLPGSKITYINLPPESIVQVVVANLEGNSLDRVIRDLCAHSNPPIECQQIRYFLGDGNFEDNLK